MSSANFQKLLYVSERMPRYAHKRAGGLTMIELLIGLLLTAAALMGAYRLFAGMVRKQTETLRSGKADLEVSKNLDRFSSEIANAVTITMLPDGSTGSVLVNLRPAPLPTSCPSKTIAQIPWGLIPYPGHTHEDMDGRTDFTPLDPSQSSLIASKPNDALRVVYFTPDSERIRLKADPASTPPAPYATQFDATQLDGVQIRVENIGRLAKGDFAIVTDGQASDLIRITFIENPGASGDIEIWHSPDVSIWNNPDFPHNYGIDYNSNVVMMGWPYLQKVKISTYAYSPAEHGSFQKEVLYRDTHEADDGFDPSTGAFNHPKTLAKNWSPVLQKVKQFQVLYEVENVPSPPDTKLVRNPRAGLIHDDSSSCGNELGKPLLFRVHVAVTLFPAGEKPMKERTEVAAVNPVNLREDLGSTDLAGLTRPLKVVTPSTVATAPPTGGFPGEGNGEF